MQTQNTQGSRSTGRDTASSIASAASEALTKTAELSSQAAQQARQAAADTASTVSDQVKEMLDRQVGTGASIIGQFAHSAKRAADDLDDSAPQIAGLVRGVADQIDHYADNLRDQTVEGLLRSASDLTRRQPALVFGLAALAGFFAFRTFKNAPGAISSPSLQPSQEGYAGADDAWRQAPGMSRGSSGSSAGGSHGV